MPWDGSEPQIFAGFWEALFGQPMESTSHLHRSWSQGEDHYERNFNDLIVVFGDL